MSGVHNTSKQTSNDRRHSRLDTQNPRTEMHRPKANPLERRDLLGDEAALRPDRQRHRLLHTARTRLTRTRMRDKREWIGFEFFDEVTEEAARLDLRHHRVAWLFAFPGCLVAEMEKP